MNRFLFLFPFFLIIFFLQQQHFLSIGGFNPNLLLISFLIIVFDNVFDFKFLFLFVLLFLTAVFYVNPFYAESVALLAILSVSFGLFKKYLTGQKIVDFAAALALSQIIFYVLINVRDLNLLSPLNLFWELVYNLILGLIVFFIYAQYENFKMSVRLGRTDKGIS